MNKSNKHDVSRRKFIKAVAYVPPAIITLNALPSVASAGSRQPTGGVDPAVPIGRRR